MKGLNHMKQFVPLSSARMSNNIILLEHLLEKRLRSERNANEQKINYQGPVDGLLGRISDRTVEKRAERKKFKWKKPQE
jgi:hypothetical protein